jgi:uncharacterized protein YunC (DUF1805 family)
MNQLQTEGETMVSPTTESTLVTDATIITETVGESAAAPAPVKKSYLKYVLLGIVVAVVIGALYNTYTKTRGDAAAIVNGTRITQTELDENVAMMTKSAAAQGIDTADEAVLGEIRTQALENLITSALLTDAAADAGMGANEAAVQSAYETLVGEVGGEEELETRMGTVGLTRETLFENITDRLMVDAYIESVTDIKSLSVTDEEVAAYLDSIKTEGVTLPPLEEIRPQIEGSLLAQKQQKVVADLIEKLRTEGNVEIIEKK